MIPAGKRRAVVKALDDEGIDYVVTDETSGREYTAVVTFPLPQAAVEPVLERLREAGIDESTYTVITEAQTVISRRFDRVEEEYSEETEGSTNRISTEELNSKAEGLVSGLWTYAVLTIISAVIATAGLLLDSPATVVGSMVIAPLIGPAMSTSVGTVIDDRELFRDGVKLQALGVAIAIASATAFAGTLRLLNLVPPGLDPLVLAEVSERVAPNVIVLAVALIPPAAAVGIGIAFRVPRLAIGSGVLVLVNVLSINLAALVMLWHEGYRPTGWFGETQARSVFIKRAAVLVAAIALLSVFLGAVTYDTYLASTHEQEIRDATVEELERVDASLELLDLEVQRTGTLPPRRTERIVVTVGIDPDDSVVGLADRLAIRASIVTGDSVEAEVQFVGIEHSDTESEADEDTGEGGADEGTDDGSGAGSG